MAHLFRPKSVKLIPKNAIVTDPDNKGKRFAKWTTRNGRQISAEVTPDGRKCRVVSPTWWIEYTDSNGLRQLVKGFRDRQATLQLAAGLEKRVNDVRLGIESAGGDSPAHLIDHLPAWKQHLTDKGVTPAHATESHSRVKEIIEGCGLTTPVSVDVEKISRWLAHERARLEWSLRTLRHRSVKLKAFGNWLVSTRRARWNPFNGLSTPNPDDDRQHIRRVLEHDQFLYLVATTRKSDRVFCDLTGPDRSSLYLIAGYTGFRISTLSRLVPESIEWFEDLPAVVFARKTKNKRPHGVPLHLEVGRELASWLRSCPAGVPLWKGGSTWPIRGAEMLRWDLEDAGIPYTDAAGQVFDFHSLRVQFISSLAWAGVALSAAQTLAGHCDPRLTSNIYTRWGKGLIDEVSKLPGIGGLTNKIDQPKDKN